MSSNKQTISPSQPLNTTSPHNNDVLCGRGAAITAHPGNAQYRKIIEKNKRAYLSARFKREKRAITQSIVDVVRNLNPPGRFLINDPRAGVWKDIGDEKAREKTGQALRENAQETRRKHAMEDAIAAAERLVVQDSIGGQQKIEQSGNQLKQDMGAFAQPTSGVQQKQTFNLQQGGIMQHHIQASTQQQTFEAVPQEKQQYDHQILHDQYQQFLQWQQSNNPHLNYQPMMHPPSQNTLESAQAQSNTWEPIPISAIANESLAQSTSLTDPSTAEDEKAIENILHQLCENNEQDHCSINGKIDLYNEEEKFASSNKLDDDEIILQLIGEDALQQNFSTGENENEVGQFDDLFDEKKENSEAVAEEECGGGLDEEFNPFLQCNFNRVHDSNVTNEPHQLHELTLHQWVVLTRSKFLKPYDEITSDQVLEYIKAELPIALKLTEFLIAAEMKEQNGQGNPIPLESIVAENVLIRARRPNLTLGEMAHQDIIECVRLVSSMGVDFTNIGSTRARLCAMGNVLYELFDSKKSISSEDGRVPVMMEPRNVSI